jgi:mRNA-degrading endonuclease RelE of RelBE toxin-antitoxin system
MILIRLDSFKKDFEKLPLEIQRRAEKQLRLFIQNPKHNSLNIKKMRSPNNIWEGRITQSYRFTFQIEGNTYVLRRMGTHDISKNP